MYTVSWQMRQLLSVNYVWGHVDWFLFAWVIDLERRCTGFWQWWQLWSAFVSAFLICKRAYDFDTIYVTDFDGWQLWSALVFGLMICKRVIFDAQEGSECSQLWSVFVSAWWLLCNRVNGMNKHEIPDGVWEWWQLWSDVMFALLICKSTRGK